MTTQRVTRLGLWATWALLLVAGVGVPAAQGQELGGAGTVQGVVKGPTGDVMVSVDVALTNPVTGFNRATTTDATGKFIFRNVPPNPYRLAVSAQAFQTVQRDVTVRSSVPFDVDISMALAGVTSTVNVVGSEGLVERDPTAHVDIDQSLVATLPREASSGLNQVITLASPGVVADANGFFHPIGDHAQTQFSIDNQPVTDQQSRIYSNQISQEAVQSMEIITGVPPAEFGDKDSLVVQIITKSGLDQPKPTGSASLGYGSFKSPTSELNLGVGTGKVGNFLSVNGMRSDRFLDAPEFQTLHGSGSSRSMFDRLDAHPNGVDAFHLNVQAARSAFAVPNTYDQDAAGQDQHQTINSFNVAPGYSRVFSTSTLLTANAYVRQDTVGYTPSTDPFADQPGTVAQNRRLRNVGAKADVAYSRGAHDVKFGGSVGATQLTEAFSLGLTDPGVNSPCLGADGAPAADATLTDIGQCTGAGLASNDSFLPDLLPFDLSRNGTPFQFNGTATVKTQALYVQDEIRAGRATVKLGLRADHYDGLTSATSLEPRLGVSVAPGHYGTILRASYGRTQETPYNENLVLASSPAASVFGSVGDPLKPGTRDQVELGVQQAIGRWLVADVGYFYKHTTNAYDFGVLFDTPIFFPISWDHSKIDGFTGRINLVEHGGVSAFMVLGHTNAIFSPPGTGGLLFEQPEADFRIDHDQKFQQTTNVQYRPKHLAGAWVALSWRYDSGLVAGSVPDYATALTLTADQQAAIGLFCGSTVATREAALTSCDDPLRGATRLAIPADGTADDVANPPRIAPRHLFDVGFGTDNLLQTTKARLSLRASVVNLTNEQALYNFLSTFSGTHFVSPRAYQVQVGVSF